MTTSTDLRNLVWQACTAIRNEHRDVKKYVEYTAILLFFKFYDDVFVTLPVDIQGIIPSDYRWSSLKKLDPRGFAGCHPEVLQRLRKFFAEKKWNKYGGFGQIFENFQFDIKHDEVLSRALISLDKINFTGISYDQKGDIYEYLISKMADAGVKGEFFTPRSIVDMVISILRPKSGMRVWDPACGTGGFLSRAFEVMQSDLNSRFAPGSEAHQHASEQLRSQSIYGNETEGVSARLARMNMILRGDGHSTILEFNSLDRQSYTKDHLDIRGAKEANPLPQILKHGGFDLIMGNPPYGGSQAVCDVSGRFKPWHTSPKPEGNFLQVMMHSLAEGGWCGVVMPEGVLFRRDEAKLRERLLKDYDLRAVIGLFKGAFEFAEVKACVLVIRKPKKSEKWKGTQSVWIAEARSTKEICSIADKLAAMTEDEAARTVPLAEIRERKNNLKPSKYLRVAPSLDVRAELLSELYASVAPAVVLEAQDVVVTKRAGENQFTVDVVGDAASASLKGTSLHLRPKDARLRSELLKFYLSHGPLSQSLEQIKTKAQLAAILNEIVPVPDQEHQKRIIKRLVTQDTIPSQILAFVGNQYRRNWVDDRIFHVEQSALLATSFDSLVEDVADYIDPSEEPETLWKVFGVSNEDGIRLSETKLGSEFKQGRAYKRLVKSAIAYNPQRINVGSVGIVGEADERSLISPYYPIFLCKEGLDTQFALNLIRSPYFRALIEETAVGAVRNELFFSLFTQIEVPIPILSRQREILKKMEAEAQRLAQYSIIRQRADEELSAIIADLFDRMHGTSDATEVRSAG